MICEKCKFSLNTTSQPQSRKFRHFLEIWKRWLIWKFSKCWIQNIIHTRKFWNCIWHFYNYGMPGFLFSRNVMTLCVILLIILYFWNFKFTAWRQPQIYVYTYFNISECNTLISRKFKNVTQHSEYLICIHKLRKCSQIPHTYFIKIKHQQL